MANKPKSFQHYLNDISDGLKGVVNALNAPNAKPDWTILGANIDAARMLLRQINNTASQTQAATQGEKIPTQEQITQATQELTNALVRLKKHEGPAAVEKIEAALHALTG